MRGVKVFRPAVLGDSRTGKLVTLWAVAAGAAAVLLFFVTKVVPLLVVPIFVVVIVGLPLGFRGLYHLLVKVEVTEEKLILTDYLRDWLNSMVRLGVRQEISFSDIDVVYYAEKEAQLLYNLRRKVKQYGVEGREEDYTKQNLTARYNVPGQIFEEFEKSEQKSLTDYTATGVMMEVENICDKYEVGKKVRGEIKRGLKDDSNFNIEFVREKLGGYKIADADWAVLADEFGNIDADLVEALLRTKINVEKYARNERGGRGRDRMNIFVNVTVVFSNFEGTRKLYFMHFHRLARKDWQAIMQKINEKRPSIRYLMSKRGVKNIAG